MQIVISAGEPSGDRYGAGLVEALRPRFPGCVFFGCAGPRMLEAGVEPVVHASALAVVGLVEVLAHIPRIYKEYRKLRHAIQQRKPDLAILIDSPDFHLRLARRLKKLSIPIVYVVAPQVWAWRKGRIPLLRRFTDRLLCIFPFEERFFRTHGIPADYIGHPLSLVVKRSITREEFFRKHSLAADRPLLVLLPGSRRGEILRHLPELLEAVERLRKRYPLQFVLAVPLGFLRNHPNFQQRFTGKSIQVIEGETWDALACAELALAASGTVTIEAALLDVPMITFYKVTALSWWLGRLLVSVPFYSMVNLVADKKIVPELMQKHMTGERLAAETSRLLDDSAARQAMREELARVREKLSVNRDPLEYAADLIEKTVMETISHKEPVHAS